MQCLSCGRAIDRAVFPGTKITCECGVEIVARASEPGFDPYRTAAPPLEPRLVDAPAPKKRVERYACPQCGQPLGHSHRGVFACGACEGMFFSEQALEELVAKARTGEETDTVDSLRSVAALPGILHEDVRYLACPICGDRMNRAIFGRKSGIVVDVCPHHGTWFDHGEVSSAVQFARTHDIARASKGPPTDDEIRKRAEVEVLLAKERIADDTRYAEWHARMDGSELTFIERLAIVIRWLRGD